MKGRNIHQEGGFLWSYSQIFILAPPSWGKEGFLSLFSLDQECLGISAWWELICKDKFCSESVMSKRLHWDARDSCLFPPFFVCLRVTYHPQMWFPAILEVLAFLCLPKDPSWLLLICMTYCLLVHGGPFSLFLSRNCLLQNEELSLGPVLSLLPQSLFNNKSHLKIPPCRDESGDSFWVLFVPSLSILALFTLLLNNPLKNFTLLGRVPWLSPESLFSLSC